MRCTAVQVGWRVGGGGGIVGGVAAKVLFTAGDPTASHNSIQLENERAVKRIGKRVTNKRNIETKARVDKKKNLLNPHTNTLAHR